jgi:hypothetical protein
MADTKRRRVLAACAGALAALAGCSGDGGTTDGGDDGSAEPTDGASPSSPTTTDGGDADGPRLGDTVSFPDSYAMTATLTTSGGTVEMSGRFHRGDMYWQFEQQDQQIEWYIVENEAYTVVGEQCFTGSVQSGLDREDVDPDAFAEGASANPTVEPAGRDTIDGEAVLVYEVSADAAGETLTYYVLADSGYLRRIESPSMQWDFSDWGAADPVQPPDADCQPMPGIETPGG